jgi:hypothetical protein
LLHCNRVALRRNFLTNCQAKDISNYRIALWRATSPIAADGAGAGCGVTALDGGPLARLNSRMARGGPPM